MDDQPGQTDGEQDHDVEGTEAEVGAEAGGELLQGAESELIA